MKKVEKTLWAVLGAVVGVAAAPMLFPWTANIVWDFLVSPYTSTPPPHIILFILPFLGVIVLGIALSFLILVRWKDWNIGLKVGLLIVIWTVVVATLFPLAGLCLIGGLRY